jgi:hypothetical protein
MKLARPTRRGTILIGALGALAIGTGAYTIAAHAAARNTTAPAVVQVAPAAAHVQAPVAAPLTVPALNQSAPAEPATVDADGPNGPNDQQGVDQPAAAAAATSQTGAVEQGAANESGAPSDGTGGHADNPSDPNANHQFDGNE